MDIFLSPHNDDETLFGAFTIMRHKPHVVICFKSDKQKQYGIEAEVRERESDSALWRLGSPSWQQLPILDTSPRQEEQLYEAFDKLDVVHYPRIVWAPAVEEGGHEQHSLVGHVAAEVFGGRVKPYLTYVRGSMRSRGREIPFEPGWPGRKMRALACYESQIMLENTQPWFLDDTLREYEP